MQPQGTGPINIAYFENVISQIEAIGNQLSYFTNGGFSNQLTSQINSAISAGGADLEQQLLSIVGTNSNFGSSVSTQISNLFLNGATPTSDQVNAVLSANAIQYPQEIINQVQSQLLGQLQNLSNSIIPSLLAQVNGITQITAAVQPFVALSVMPVTDLTSAITFINSFKTAALVPQATSYAKYVTQLAQLLTQISSITSSINSASQTLGGTVQVPTKPTIQSQQSASVIMTITRH